MSIHLAHMTVNADALGLYAAQLGMHDDDGCYALHHAMRMRFGQAAPQPFRADLRGSSPHVIGYLDDPHALVNNRGENIPTEAPSVICDIFPEAAKTKPMPALWDEDRVLSFRLRARTVVRYSKQERDRMEERTGWRPQGSEIDAFAAEKLKNPNDPMDLDEVCRRWLERRLKDIAHIEDFAVLDYRRIRTRRSTHGKKGSSFIEGPDTSLAGNLVVLDKEKFRDILKRGVGRHSAFGYGMLLLGRSS